LRLSIGTLESGKLGYITERRVRLRRRKSALHEESLAVHLYPTNSSETRDAPV
jgi:hypothetical protein